VVPLPLCEGEESRGLISTNLNGASGAARPRRCVRCAFAVRAV